jgi:transcriptional regulator with XRE-family HTH domain
VLFREAIGAVARDLRTSRQVSLRGFATQAGLSPTYVGEVERGLKDVSSENIARIAEHLDLAQSSLLEQTADLIAQDESASPRLTAGQHEAIRELRRLSRSLRPSDLQTLLEFARFLATKNG